MDSGNDAILELGLVQAAAREEFYSRVDGTDYSLRTYLIDTPLEVRRQRVRNRNTEKGSTYKMEVSDEIFNVANGFWQEPDSRERNERNIEVITAS